MKNIDIASPHFLHRSEKATFKVNHLRLMLWRQAMVMQFYNFEETRLVDTSTHNTYSSENLLEFHQSDGPLNSGSGKLKSPAKYSTLHKIFKIQELHLPMI